MESVLIVGTGALACLFGARLANAGIKVYMLGSWLEGIEALNTHGIRFVNSDGREEVFPVTASSDSSDFSEIEHALVLVKAWQTEVAASMLMKILSPNGTSLTLQNGLGNREKLISQLGENRVFQGTTTTGATLLAPGKVKQGGEGVITLTRAEGSSIYLDVLSRAGFSVETTINLDALLWKKLIVNAGINPMTALLNIPNGKLLESDYAFSLAKTLANEAYAVAIAAGVDLTGVDSAALVRQVAEKTASNHSSMLQDIKRGAPTEIDAICGEIVRIGAEAGVLTPVNETIWKLIKAKVELS